MSRRWSRQQWRPVEAVLDAQGDLKLVRSQENGWKIMENLCWILQIRGFLVMSAILGCSCPSAIKGNQQTNRWFAGGLEPLWILPRMAPEDFNQLSQEKHSCPIQSWLVRYSSSHHFHPISNRVLSNLRYPPSPGNGSGDLWSPWKNLGEVGKCNLFPQTALLLANFIAICQLSDIERLRTCRHLTFSPRQLSANLKVCHGKWPWNFMEIKGPSSTNGAFSMVIAGIACLKPWVDEYWACDAKPNHTPCISQHTTMWLWQSTA